MMALLLAAGGGIGAVCRYLVGLFYMNKLPRPPIPFAMIIVNLIGSLGLGLLYGGMYDDPEILYGNTIFIALGLGFFGAFTTFSTFSVEAVQLLINKLYKNAGMYVVLSIAGSILGFILGFFLMNLELI
ncbi:chromosome condensation protein CrcB [Bacillus sp. LL01]|nr:chromosome condensation protein CrcB [Bacillus sp. LL01]